MKKYRDYFDKYTKHYYEIADDFQKTHIKRKIDHSMRVCDYSIEICNYLNLDSHDVYLVSIAGLLHDIGRFRQFYEFSTFIDKNSFNHGEVGASILIDDGILDELSDEDKNIVLEVVRLHNRRSLPDNLDSKIKLFSTIIRDADKIDYMYAMVNIIPKLPKKDQLVFYSNMLDSDKISDEMVLAVLNGEVIDKYKLNTIGEIKACTVYDILKKFECSASYEIIKKEKFIDKIYDLIDSSEERDIIFSYVRKKIN